MDKDLRSKAFSLKNEGVSYSNIAENTGLSVNTIKSLFRRQNSKEEENYTSCKNCGKELNVSSNSRLKKFCSDECRFKWWNKNGTKSRKQMNDLICINCGKKFKCYESKKRKYCGHECYIKHRFKK